MISMAPDYIKQDHYISPDPRAATFWIFSIVMFLKAVYSITGRFFPSVHSSAKRILACKQLVKIIFTKFLSLCLSLLLGNVCHPRSHQRAMANIGKRAILLISSIMIKDIAVITYDCILKGKYILSKLMLTWTQDSDFNAISILDKMRQSTLYVQKYAPRKYVQLYISRQFSQLP